MIFTSKMFEKFLESMQLQSSCLSKLSASYVRESWKGSESKELIAALKKSLAMAQKCEGKIVVTSLGRFGKVGEVLASTFTAVGTESTFLHSSEALNGDLSVVHDEDLLLVLHDTGNKSEVVEVAKICHAKGIPVISLCDATKSALGDVSDVVLELGIYPSIGVQDLTPTTSLILMISIGNALASGLCYMNSMSEKDLEELHPASEFGTKEMIKVRDVMVEVETIPTSTLFEDLVSIVSASCRETVFVSELGNVVGVVTSKDISKAIDSSESKATLFTKVSAADIMNTDVRTVNEDDLCVDTLETMKLCKVTSLLVDTKKRGSTFIVDLHNL